MKIAIIGGGPAGLLAAWEFYRLGAEVTLFGGNTLGGGVRRLGEMVPDFSMEVPLVELLPASLQGDEDPGRIPTVGEYGKKFIEPLGKSLQSLVRIKNVRAVRFHKSFLGEGEIPQGHSRLLDLFRVVWVQDHLETYEDFDIVIEAEGPFHRPLPAGSGKAPALNEGKWEAEGIVSKSWGIFDHLARLSGKERVLLVGSGAIAALFCHQFFSRFPDGNLDLVTVEMEPFEGLGKGRFGSGLFEGVQSIIEDSYQRWKEDCRNSSLPSTPLPRFCIYNGYNVVSIDKLEDRSGVFATIEAPPFRREKGGLKTLSVEGVAVATGFEKTEKSREPGLYRLRGDIPTLLGQIRETRESVLSFFSRG